MCDLEQVILVDETDKPIGLMEKQAAHNGPHLHRAFSIFVFNSKGELLMQQRALSKYHSPGLWTNTCCSHPRDGETLAQATSRRLMEEMGMQCEMKEAYTFIYQAPVGQGLTEHELDHVWIGHSDTTPLINREEVEAWKYMRLDDIAADIHAQPQNYTEWFKITFDTLVDNINKPNS